MPAKTCSVCQQTYERPPEPHGGHVVTRIGPFGVVQQTVYAGDEVIHSCPPLPHLLRADRTLFEELLVRGLDGPVDALDVVRSARRRLPDDRLEVLGLVVEALGSGWMKVLEADRLSPSGRRWPWSRGESDASPWETLQALRNSDLDRSSDSSGVRLRLIAAGPSEAAEIVWREAEGRGRGEPPDQSTAFSGDIRRTTVEEASQPVAARILVNAWRRVARRFVAS